MLCFVFQISSLFGLLFWCFVVHSNNEIYEIHDSLLQLNETTLLHVAQVCVERALVSLPRRLRPKFLKPYFWNSKHVAPTAFLYHVFQFTYWHSVELCTLEQLSVGVIPRVFPTLLLPSLLLFQQPNLFLVRLALGFILLCCYSVTRFSFAFAGVSILLWQDLVFIHLPLSFESVGDAIF